MKKRSLRLSPADSERVARLRARCDDTSVSAVVGLAIIFLEQQLPLDPELLSGVRAQLEGEGRHDVETTVTSMTLGSNEEAALDRMTLTDVKPRFTTNQLARIALLMFDAAGDAEVQSVRRLAPVRPRTGPRPKSLKTLLQ